MLREAHPSSQVFGGLADPTRMEILDRLQSGAARSTTQLMDGMGMSRQAVRKHLGVLAEAGLVSHERQGRRRLWALDARPLKEASDWLTAYRHHWEARLDRLEALLVTLEDRQ